MIKVIIVLVINPLFIKKPKETSKENKQTHNKFRMKQVVNMK